VSAPATPFGDIIKRAVEATPGAVGGAFADSEGEMVDCFATVDKHDWAVLTAHYGVVMSHLQHAFGTWHYGGAEYFIAQHAQLDVVVYSVAHGYYALLAVKEHEGSAPLAVALAQLRAASAELRKEIA
jgi:hypothetical protein